MKNFKRLKSGSHYRARSGDVLRIKLNPGYPPHSEYIEDNDGGKDRTWFRSGDYDSLTEHEHDLVELID